VLLAIYLHEDFIDKERITVTSMLALQSLRLEGSKLDTPEPDGFIADSYTAFSHQIFDIAVA
jgi:hypothetical protein